MSDGFLTTMLQSLAALSAVLALFAFIVWLVRRLQGPSFSQHGEQMKIVQRLVLDTKHSLVKVACGQHHYLIGLSPNGLTPIAEDIEQTEDQTTQPPDAPA